MAKIYQSVEEFIGRTPLMEVRNIERKYDLEARLLVKLEYMNPAGSVKDRAAKYMIEDAEKAGPVSYTHLDVYKRQPLGPVGRLKGFLPWSWRHYLW